MQVADVINPRPISAQGYWQNIPKASLKYKQKREK